MASASSTVSVPAPKEPLRAPPWLMLPEKIRRTFSPKAAIWASTCDLAPLPMLTIAITAATPMIMPSAVRMERMALRRRARRETVTVEPRCIRRGRSAMDYGSWAAESVRR